MAECKNYSSKWVFFLNNDVKIKIDRPLGSLHPKWNFRYEINYGYVPGVISGDMEELDAYVLGVDEPIDEMTGICIAIIHRLNEDDDKLIVVPNGKTFTNDEIIEKTKFQEQFFESIIIR